MEIRISKGNLKDFHKRLGADYGVRFVNYAPLAKFLLSRIMRRVSAAALIPDELLELRPMCVNDTVLLPWSPGTTKVDPQTQILVAVHEVVHARRIDRYVTRYHSTIAGWYTQYFINANFRALEEAAAIGEENAVAAWITGQYPPHRDLTGYCLDDKAQKLVERAHNLRYKVHKDLGLRGEVATNAVRILQSLGV